MEQRCPNAAQSSVPMKLYDLMLARDECAREKWTKTGDWLDTEQLVCNVTSTHSGNHQEARVDLKALFRKDWKGSCSKSCQLFDDGLCVHVMRALQAYM